MSGLDKIISQIKEEADASAAEILGAANSKADSIRRQAEEDCREVSRRAETQNEEAREDILEKSRSSAQMQQRREMLNTKQQLIDEIIDDAHSSLLALPDAEYFDTLIKLVAKHAQPQKGEISLCQRDLDRMPADFGGKAAEAAKSRGGDLTMSEKPCQIDGGFLLIYGDIEENCSFEALFSSDKEDLQDTLHAFLFA